MMMDTTSTRVRKWNLSSQMLWIWLHFYTPPTYSYIIPCIELDPQLNYTCYIKTCWPLLFGKLLQKHPFLGFQNLIHLLFPDWFYVMVDSSVGLLQMTVLDDNTDLMDTMTFYKANKFVLSLTLKYEHEGMDYFCANSCKWNEIHWMVFRGLIQNYTLQIKTWLM